jgi:hypothetical protein
MDEGRCMKRAATTIFWQRRQLLQDVFPATIEDATPGHKDTGDHFAGNAPKT